MYKFSPRHTGQPNFTLCALEKCLAAATRAPGVGRLISRAEADEPRRHGRPYTRSGLDLLLPHQLMISNPAIS